jgi:hypothetical protein
MGNKRTKELGTGRPSEQHAAELHRLLRDSLMVRTLLSTLVASGGSTNWR